MLTVALALALAQYPAHWLQRQPNLPTSSYAFFEFAPTSGAGMPAACSTTAPTGAKGEAMTFSRGSVATCTSTAAGGLVSSGIANGDLVELSSNVARVEFDSAGVKGLRVEGSGQNVLPRFIDYTNGSWADVGTPTPTTGQASPFSGTYANSAVLYDDNDAAAFEGRTTTVNTTPGSAYIAHCYVKAGTLAKARIVLDGTAATITGLSSSTWSIIEVADASASAANITFEVDNGSVASDTGTVVWGGCDVKLGTYRTSIVPTVAAAVTRSAEVPQFNNAIPIGTTFSMAASVNTPSVVLATRVPLYYSNGGTDRGGIYPQATVTTLGLERTGAVFATKASAYSAGAVNRIAGYFDGANGAVCSAGTCGTAAASTYGSSVKTLYLTYTSTTLESDSIISRVCFDPDPARCR